MFAWTVSACRPQARGKIKIGFQAPRPNVNLLLEMRMAKTAVIALLTYLIVHEILANLFAVKFRACRHRTISAGHDLSSKKMRSSIN